ncbi:hypothetical protein [Streptomyces aureoversilis]|uniref:Uncharacterized protein n=1 Tax=Streptomyces aureoversilis TaxID=67277 RepID=A0ABV9ZV27_9ACTN
MITHAPLADHARCLYGDESRCRYGDEYRDAPKSGGDHREHYFVGELTFADADSIVTVLWELSPHLVGGCLPVRLRNLSYRLPLLQRPDNSVLMREAADSLYLLSARARLG